MLFPLAPDPLAEAQKPHQRRRTRGDLGDGAEGIIRGVLLHWHRFRTHLIPSAPAISSKRAITRPPSSSHNLIRRGCGCFVLRLCPPYIARPVPSRRTRPATL